MSNEPEEPLESTQRANALLSSGMSLEEDGDKDEAIQCYEAALRLSPGLARAHFNMGNIFLDRGEFERAISCYENALRFKPDSAGSFANIGAAHLRMGNPNAAIASCRRAIALKDELFDAHATIGAALAKLGNQIEAIATFRRAMAIKPDSVEVLCNLAMAQLDCNFTDDALSSLDSALDLAPDSWEVHQHRGIVYQTIGKLDIAAQSYMRALVTNPNSAELHNNMGGVLRESGKLDESEASFGRTLTIDPFLAEAHYNLGLTLQRGEKLDLAVNSYRRAIELKPEFVLAHNNLGVVLGQLGRDGEALACFQSAIDIQPDYTDGHRNMGISLVVSGHPLAGIASFRRAIALSPADTDAHIGLGNALKDAGDIDSAITSFRQALQLEPANFLAHSNLLLTLSYSENYSADEAFAAAVQFGDIAARVARPYLAWPNAPDPVRRLRIGFVSGDLREHPVGYFLEDVLSSLMRRGFDLIAYATVPNQDERSHRIRASCAIWRVVAGLTDEDLAKQVQDDGVDILVDLAGHTAHNRTAMFAWKPAPVQVSWLGYFATTGLKTMDYVMADPWTLTVEQEKFYSERIWRLPETRLCFSAPFSEEVGQLPALRNGYLTFGSFNNPSKMTDSVVEVWAEILSAVPNSRLLLKYKQFTEPKARDAVRRRFARHGTDLNRIFFEGNSSRADYLLTYQKLDVALDTFPYTGGTTSVESMWMGVPVLTLSGASFLSRQGVGLLMNVGLTDWIASCPKDYVKKAADLTADIKSLAALRATLRQRANASPIFDAPRFAKFFDIALRDMWQKWCKSQQMQQARSD